MVSDDGGLCAHADYEGDGIFNLMQSIAHACGSPASGFAQCKMLPAARLGEARHVVLFIVDGLGLPALAGLAESSPLRRHLTVLLSSVFPSTTASAITTFMTGLAPAQHGLTGWHVQVHEIDQMLAILPMTVRAPGAVLPVPVDVLSPSLFPYPTFFQRMSRECFVVAPRRIAGTPFNTWHARGATTCAYATLPELFAQLGTLLTEASVPRYIHAYFPDFDSLAHRFGCASDLARAVLSELNRAFTEFLASITGTDTHVIVTADHGFIDAPPERVICLDDHPRLAAMMARPLSGERRVAYCHVQPSHRCVFADYVREHLAHAISLHASRDLIDAGWFGPPPFCSALRARVGDYTLVMKDDWTITDWLPGEKRYPLVGVHGGVSVEEMSVPLIDVRV